MSETAIKEATTSTSGSASAKANPARTAARARRFLFPLAAMLVGLMMAFVGLEVTFRLLDIRPPQFITKRILHSPDPQVHYFCYPGNPHGEMIPRPDTSQGNWRLSGLSLPPENLPLDRLVETPWCIEYRFSKQGLRDRDYTGPPPAGIRRIAGVGDSFAQGEGVPLAQSLFRQIEQMLGPGYEVVNGGHSGYDLNADLNRWRELKNLDCSRAIVVFIANDIGLSSAMQNKQAYINDLINIRQENLDRAVGSSATSSRLLDWCRMKLALHQVTQDTVQWYLDLYSDANGKNVALLEQTIRGFVSDPSYPTVFVLYPLLEGLEQDPYPLKKIYDMVGGMLQSAGIPYLDLTSVFRGRETSSLWVHEVDHHPNGQAHRLAAEAIVRWLKTEQPNFLTRPQPPPRVTPESATSPPATEAPASPAPAAS